MYPMWSAALGLAFFTLIPALFQSNYYLNDRQNAADNTDTTGALVEGDTQDQIPKTRLQKILSLWDQ